MKRAVALILSVCIFCGLCGCGTVDRSVGESKLSIVATLFPQYDFARQIAGDRADVTLLLPPGGESHSYDPTPSAILAVNRADIFIYTGKYMEPWAESLAQSAENAEIVDASSGIALYREEEDDEHEHGHEHDGYDPHIWLDIRNAIAMVRTITDAVIAADPDGRKVYEANSARYIAELTRLDEEFADTIASADSDTMVFAGRFAYLYFIKRNGLNYMSVYDSCSAQAEPSVAKMNEVADFITENNIKAIYYEELSRPLVANAIAEECGIKALVFSTVHNISKEQLAEGATYISIMRENLAALKEGLLA